MGRRGHDFDVFRTALRRGTAANRIDLRRGELDAQRIDGLVVIRNRDALALQQVLQPGAAALTRLDDDPAAAAFGLGLLESAVQLVVGWARQHWKWRQRQRQENCEGGGADTHKGLAVLFSN